MATSISSKNLKGSTELTVLASIKQGLVQIPDPMSYTTRLERLLEVLFLQRKKSVETGASGFVGPLEMLRSLHFVHWAIIDSGTRLLLTVAYDKPWEPYIRSIVDDAGPILDVIFFHCEGYEQSTTRHGYPAFAKWVRERQQNTSFFFADFPELSVDDIRHLQELRKLHDDDEVDKSSDALSLKARVPELVPAGDQAQLLKTVLGLYRLKAYYPQRRLADGTEDPYSDRAIYNRAVRLIAQGYSSQPLEDIKKFPPPIDTAFKQIEAAYNDFRPWYDSIIRDVPGPFAAPKTEPPLSEIQANIIQGYPRMNHGCVALLKLPREVHRRSEALFYLAERMNTQAKENAAAPGLKFNVAFTYNGLKAAGLGSAELDALPLEFREGMETRAGALGDVGAHHPENWQRPSRNWPPEAQPGGRTALSAVEVVAILQTWADDSSAATASSADRPPGPQLLKVLEDEVASLQLGGFQVLHVQPLQRYTECYRGDAYREHFGYLDGLSEVIPKPQPNLAKGAYNNDISYGEVLVGHPNDHGDASPYTGSKLLMNGSFLVIRKLAQDVGGFRAYVTEATRSVSESVKSEDELMGLLMGRTPDGTPLGAKPPEDRCSFSYEIEAPGKLGCPFQAHARLANPRTDTKSSVHGKPRRVPRLVRRGFSYGPPFGKGQDKEPRGLVFMAYVASIAEQYEIVQRWLNGGSATGLPSTQNDPITAPAHDGRAPFRFRDPEGNVVKLPPITQPFVTLEWGLYLFSPSLSGVRYMAQAAATPAEPAAALVAGGEKVLSMLLKVDDPLAWKKILEGQGEREKAWAVWAAIRARGGVLKTSYGVLVGSEDAALQVLKDETRFSTREYWMRMKASSIPMHLGMDKKPLPEPACPVKHAPDQEYVDDVKAGIIDYDKESIANQLVAKFRLGDTFRSAYRTTRALLAQSTETPGSARRIADLFVLGELVIARLSQEWFGLPDGEYMKLGGLPVAGQRAAHCPADFTYVAQHFFRPNPDPWTAQLSLARGRVIHQAAQDALKSGDTKQFHKDLRAAIAAKVGADAEDLQDRVVRALVGAVDGFVAANWGSFVSTISLWVKTQDFWQVQIECEDELTELGKLVAEAASVTSEEATKAWESRMVQKLHGSALIKRVHHALMLLPVPAWLHRTALKETVLNGVKVAPGDRLALHLGSIALDKKNPEMLFGGAYNPYQKGPDDGQTPQHACPARPMGLGVVLGMIAAVLELKSVSADGPLALSFDAPPKP
ncbi:MAG TPA: hypothetical protein VJN18_09525 [Polyangiaceae bacterium]|nr:hypothetical protein [Polyangiaceae bacterium]